jgi:hypothetical protein
MVFSDNRYYKMSDLEAMDENPLLFWYWLRKKDNRTRSLHAKFLEVLGLTYCEMKEFWPLFSYRLWFQWQRHWQHPHNALVSKYWRCIKHPGLVLKLCCCNIRRWRSQWPWPHNWETFFEFDIPHGINSEEDSKDVDNHDVAVYIDENIPRPIYSGSSHMLGECYLNALFA